MLKKLLIVVVLLTLVGCYPTYDKKNDENINYYTDFLDENDIIDYEEEPVPFGCNTLETVYRMNQINYECESRNIRVYYGTEEDTNESVTVYMPDKVDEPNLILVDFTFNLEQVVEIIDEYNSSSSNHIELDEENIRQQYVNELWGGLIINDVEMEIDEEGIQSFVFDNFTHPIIYRVGKYDFGGNSKIEVYVGKNNDDYVFFTQSRDHNTLEVIHEAVIPVVVEEPVEDPVDDPVIVTPLECDDGYIVEDNKCVFDLANYEYPVPIVEVVNITEFDAQYTIDIPENAHNLQITNLMLVKGDIKTSLMGSLVGYIPNLEEFTDYVFEYTYTYELIPDRTVVEFTETIPFKTRKVLLPEPSVIMTLGDLHEDQAKIALSKDDPLDLITIDAITLFEDGLAINTLRWKKTLFIYNLQPGIKYTVKIDYTYDLGEGDIQDSESIDFYTPNPIVSYFLEIALGSEFGNDEEVTKRWTEPINIYVDGHANDDVLAELDRIIEELNELITTDIQIEIVDVKTNANLIVVFSGKDYYANTYGIDPNLAEENWGLFNIEYDDDNHYYYGTLYVDTERATTEEQFHILREELTQSLGLAQDSYTYPDSIFYQQWSTVREYSEIDRDLIWLLYHPDMSTGLTAEEVTIILNEIIANGMPNHED